MSKVRSKRIMIIINRSTQFLCESYSKISSKKKNLKSPKDNGPETDCRNYTISSVVTKLLKNFSVQES